ncbi:hypothetical protein [Quadrisphaera setariae]|uniref:Cytotoxic translational repressor of toxin-antitoxin stability system n=1 Tax=Quadrisphaera setariae TaxID=2593304 RepID=A0A5C8Z3R0_9ACTN|nr:hypothetical protein [Quadrisphaera setariae]TXR51570.1 hypothetical protein FMM08_22225 [Quadrisphaera setariae]
MTRGAPVPHPSGWQMRFANRKASVGWASVVAQASSNAATAWGQILTTPRHISERQHPLKGKLAQGAYEGQTLERWQYEVTGGGRLWYLIDDQAKTIWLEMASTSHPKATDRRR